MPCARPPLPSSQEAAPTRPRRAPARTRPFAEGAVALGVVEISASASDGAGVWATRQTESVHSSPSSLTPLPSTTPTLPRRRLRRRRDLPVAPASISTSLCTGVLSCVAEVCWGTARAVAASTAAAARARPSEARRRRSFFLPTYMAMPALECTASAVPRAACNATRRDCPGAAKGAGAAPVWRVSAIYATNHKMKRTVTFVR